MICRFCGEVVDCHEGALFGVPYCAADVRLAHIECIAVETLKLIYQREVERTFGTLVMPSSTN
jgi:hypothetical protein